MIPFLNRGPRLGTKLMLLGFALLIVPWFSFRQLVQMESFLVQGQSQAQLLTAKGISTLLNGRQDLFNDLPISLDGYEALYAHPLTTPVRIDGRASDWADLADKKQRFGAGRESGAAPDGSFDLLLGERGGQLYVLLEVHDDARIWRNPNALRLDNADHVRLSYVTSRGSDGRLQIALQEPGVTTAYSMDSDWRFAEDGQPENRLQGFMTETETGYLVEFRIPLSMLGSRRSFGLSVADVDDGAQREIRTITQTLPTAGPESFNLVVLRSPEVLNIIRGLGYSGARILVVDPQQRVRAESGSYSSKPAEPESGDWASALLDPLRPIVRELVATARSDLAVRQGASVGEEVIRASIAGQPASVLRRLANGEEIIMAAHPIVGSDEDIIGSVVVEQNTDDILELQREAMERIIIGSVVSLFAVFVVLLAFSVRLAWRIRGLGAEATNSIDQ
ncbi:MAG: hypothetical protein V2J24_12075, partial [Pseudomonadales bacterium]|nr:hypothetical protein [Pseudomonadales bacterium]